MALNLNIGVGGEQEPTSGNVHDQDGRVVTVALTGAVPQQSIPAGTSAAGAGTAFDWGVARANHSLAIVGSAGIASGAVSLQGSLDGTNWFQLIAPVTAVASVTTPGSVANFPARYVRANITTVIGSGTVAVSVASV